ncbi:MAG: diaminopimelate epimerase [Acidobacteriota bacterium]|nr:diaminopimelate epimerase [Acidobacteriota bacterium]
MRFTKLHGLGNDYIYIDAISQDLSAYDLPALSRVLSDRNFGIGGDGIILVSPSEIADFAMRIYNSDGSEAEMCGNGMRAFAKFVYEHGLTEKTSLEVETYAGIIKPVLTVEDGKVTLIRVDMGEPRLARSEIPMAGEPADQPVIAEPLQVNGHDLKITCVSMGNPHCVVFVDDADSFPVRELGPVIECHPLFPRKTNVEFASIDDRRNIQMRVWERGAGVTLACGTGASATVVAAVLNDLADRTARVSLLGGDLFIEWAEDNHVFLTGPADEAFSGEVHPDLLAQALK